MNCSLVSDEQTLTTCFTKELELGIPPQFIGHEEKAIARMLMKKKNTYYNQLHGIMLRFDDLELLDKTGRIIDDNPLMYWRFSAKFTVLSLPNGQIIRTQVITIGVNYIRSLMADSISVDIQMDPRLTPEEQSLCLTLKPGDDVICCVQTFTLAEKCITAIIDKLCIEQMRLLYGV